MFFLSPSSVKQVVRRYDGAKLAGRHGESSVKRQLSVPENVKKERERTRGWEGERPLPLCEPSKHTQNEQADTHAARLYHGERCTGLEVSA